MGLVPGGVAGLPHIDHIALVVATQGVLDDLLGALPALSATQPHLETELNLLIGGGPSEDFPTDPVFSNTFAQTYVHTGTPKRAGPPGATKGAGLSLALESAIQFGVWCK